MDSSWRLIIFLTTGLSKTAYFVPILFIGSTLGTPLLPLTVECHDFLTIHAAADQFATAAADRQLLQKWYQLDTAAVPQCYRLQTDVRPAADATDTELRQLLNVIVQLSGGSKELRDSYLTTLVEQQINNTVLINAELAKRCVWVQTGSWPTRLSDGADALEEEMLRRMGQLHAELKMHLSERNLIRIPPSVQVHSEQLSGLYEQLLGGVLDGICEEHASKYQIPRCTFGVDGNLLRELEAVNQYSVFLEQNCVNFGIMDRIRR